MHANNHSCQGAQAGRLPRVGGSPELHSETLGGREGGKRKQCNPTKKFSCNYCYLKLSSIHPVQCFKEYMNCILTDLQVLNPSTEYTVCECFFLVCLFFSPKHGFSV